MKTAGLFLALLAIPASVCAQPAPPLFTLTVEGKAMELHEFAQGAFAQFELSKPVDVEIRAGFDVRWVEIRPKSAGVVPVMGSDHASVKFRIQRPAPLTVEFNSDLKKVVHLFAYEPERDAPARGAANVRYFGPGRHEPGLMDLKDGETLYLAAGAWVKGNVRSVGTRNVVIRGRGVLDGTDVPRRGGGNMIYLEKTTGARIEGITIFNSMDWTVYVRKSQGTRIEGVRVLNPSVHYGNDGFDIVSSSDVVIENTFVRTNDDCVVVKNLDDVETHNIVVRKAVFWNMPTGGNGIEIGFELRNQRVHDIRFEDIDIIHVERGSAISIHHGDAAVVENIVFDNIRVEDVRRKLIDFAVIFAQYGLDRPVSAQERQRRMERGGSWDGSLSYTPEEKPERAKFRGHIRNVLVRNLHVVEGMLPYSVLAGFDEQHLVDGVVIEGLKYQGRAIRSAAEGKFSMDHAHNVQFR